MKLQLSTLILSSLTMTAVVAQCPDCWCVPDEPTDVCPPIGNRIDVDDPTRSAPVIEFYQSLIPEDGGLFELYPPGCEPFPIVAALFNLTICEGVVAQSGGKMGRSSASTCAFDFSGDLCDGGTYSVYDDTSPETYDDRMLKKGKKDTKEDKKKKKKDKKKGKKDKKKGDKGNNKASRGALTHQGSCGVCSSAQDLVALLNPNMKEDHRVCSEELTTALLDPSQLPNILPNFIECHKGMGFTDACAKLWSSQWFAMSLEAMRAFEAIVPGSTATYDGPESCTRCAELCFPNFDNDLCFEPFDGTTCALSPCAQCDADTVQPIFARFAGRTRRSSGIADVDTRYFCSETANIGQFMETCPVPDPITADPPPPAPVTADPPPPAPVSTVRPADDD